MRQNHDRLCANRIKGRILCHILDPLGLKHLIGRFVLEMIDCLRRLLLVHELQRRLLTTKIQIRLFIIIVNFVDTS